MRRFIFTALIFITFIASAQDKWHGDFSFYGGTNFKYVDNKWSNNLFNGTASFGYSDKKFFFDASALFSYEYHIKDKVGVGDNFNGNDTLYNMDFSLEETNTNKANANLTGGWNINNKHKIRFRYSYDYKQTITDNYVISIAAKNTDFTSLQCSSLNAMNTDKNNHKAGLSHVYSFDKVGRTITSDFYYHRRNTKSNSLWNKGLINDEEHVTQYRITPDMTSDEFEIMVKYNDDNFSDVNGLNVDFSLGLDYNQDNDHQSAATLVDDEWVDSIDFRSNFIFKTITISPKLHALWTVGIYTLDVSYTPQFYTRELDDDDYDGYFRDPAISHLIKAYNTLAISKSHSLSLNYERNIERPKYQQICWFQRTGTKYNNELYQGNPDLKPSASHKISLSYTFTKNRFSATAKASYEYVFRIIEQTFYNDTIDGKLFRVYSWLNGGDSKTGEMYLKLAWKADVFKADASVTYKNYKGTSMSGRVTRSSDYELRANLSYTPKTWIFLVSGHFTSDIIRSYTSKTSIVGLDFKVEKKFGKCTVFAEARDIFDKEITIETISADERGSRTENIKNYKRLYLIGFKYKF